MNKARCIEIERGILLMSGCSFLAPNDVADECILPLVCTQSVVGLNGRKDCVLYTAIDAPCLSFAFKLVGNINYYTSYLMESLLYSHTLVYMCGFAHNCVDRLLIF